MLTMMMRMCELGLHRDVETPTAGCELSYLLIFLSYLLLFLSYLLRKSDRMMVRWETHMWHKWMISLTCVTSMFTTLTS